METTLQKNILFHFVEKHIDTLDAKDINSRGKELKDILENMKNNINQEIEPRLFENINRIENSNYGDLIISDMLISYVNLGKIELFDNALQFIKKSFIENKKSTNEINKKYDLLFKNIEANILKETFLNKFGKKNEFEKAYEKIRLLRCEMIQ